MVVSLPGGAPSDVLGLCSCCFTITKCLCFVPGHQIISVYRAGAKTTLLESNREVFFYDRRLFWEAVTQKRTPGVRELPVQHYEGDSFPV